ncbi:hypothetical protein [Sulfitobacter sp. 1A15106]|uniref:hypothetical protein n=1 Tax=Sulfitobacter sp. 1A15106 TaxID=3368590 RepID=UPI003747608D
MLIELKFLLWAAALIGLPWMTMWMVPLLCGRSLRSEYAGLVSALAVLVAYGLGIHLGAEADTCR